MVRDTGIEPVNALVWCVFRRSSLLSSPCRCLPVKFTSLYEMCHKAPAWRTPTPLLMGGPGDKAAGPNRCPARAPPLRRPGMIEWSRWPSWRRPNWPRSPGFGLPRLKDGRGRCNGVAATSTENAWCTQQTLTIYFRGNLHQRTCRLCGSPAGMSPGGL